MDERELLAMRREPRPEFARELRERLHRQGPARAAAGAGAPRLGWALAAGLTVAVAVLGFTVPAVRVSAQAFLDLFRVRNFAAVPVDPARLERLKDERLDPASVLAGGRPEVLQEPSAPRAVATVAEASALAGFPVRTPSSPAGVTADSITVIGAGAVRFAVDGARLQRVFELLDLRDLEVPAGLAGQAITVRTSPTVRQLLHRGQRSVALIQARSPEVELPAGLDLARLGEIGLRVAGLDAGEARRFARSVDWHSTLVVPVPLDAASFTTVSVHGHQALLVRSGGRRPDGEPGARRADRLLLWSDGDMVYALAGGPDEVELVEMAESLN